MPVSIKDIARLAGVSHSTVSRALHNSPLIPAETTKRIQKIADEQGYTASAVARSLVTRKTHAIGVVVTSVADPFNGDIVDGIEEVANQDGYSVILATSQTDPEREIAVVRSFKERRVDGILVASSRVGALYLPVLSELKTPVVLLNNQGEDTNVNSVSVDNVDGAYQATRHLLDLGHRQIAYIGDRFGFQSDHARRLGFQKACDEAGVDGKAVRVAAGNGRLDGAEPAVRELFSAGQRPSALFCYNDMTALGAIRTLEELKVRVPDDVSVVGFDDIVFAELARPTLTTVRQPRREMGRKAAQMLLSLIGKLLTEKTARIRGELIIRESTSRLDL